MFVLSEFGYTHFATPVRVRSFVRSFVNRSLGPSGNWQQRSRSVSNNLATERQTGNKTLTSFGSRPTTSSTRRRGKKERDRPRATTATAEETDKTRSPSLLLRYLSIFAPLKNRQLGRPPPLSPLPPPSSLLTAAYFGGIWPTAAAEETGESQNLGIKLFTVQSGYNETDHNI